MSKEDKMIAELCTSYFVSRVAFRCVHAGETTLILNNFVPSGVRSRRDFIAGARRQRPAVPER